MKPRYIGIVIAAIGALIFLIGALSVRGTTIPIVAEFGIGNVLPIWTWIGFSLAIFGCGIIGWFGAEYEKVGALIIIGLVIWCVPLAIEQLPRHNDAFWHMSASLDIAKTGHLNFQGYNLQYEQYPALFLITAQLLEFGNPPFWIMYLYPIFVIIFFTLSFYLLSRSLLKKTQLAFTATAFAIVGNIAMFPNHYSPSATAQALLPLILYMVLKTDEHIKGSRGILCLALIFVGSYVLFHPAIPIFVSLLIAGIALFRRSMNLGIFALFNTVLFFGWMSTIGAWGWSNFIKSIEGVMKLLLNLEAKTPATTLISQQSFFPLIGYIKAGLFVFFVCVGLLAVGWSLRKNFSLKSFDSITVLYLTVLPIALVLSSVTVIYGRALVWVVPFSILAVVGTFGYLIKNRKVVQAIFLVSLLFFSSLTFLSYYNGEASWVTTPSGFQGAKFTSSILQNSTTVLSNAIGIVEYFNVYQVSIKSIPLSFQERDYISLQWAGVSNLVVLQRSDYAWQYLQVEGTAQNSYVKAFNNCTTDVNLNMIYQSGDYTVFARNSREIASE